MSESISVASLMITALLAAIVLGALLVHGIAKPAISAAFGSGSVRTSSLTTRRSQPSPGGMHWPSSSGSPGCRSQLSHTRPTKSGQATLQLLRAPFRPNNCGDSRPRAVGRDVVCAAWDGDDRAGEDTAATQSRIAVSDPGRSCKRALHEFVQQLHKTDSGEDTTFVRTNVRASSLRNRPGLPFDRLRERTPTSGNEIAHFRSKRSSSITFTQAATKSVTNFSPASSEA